MKCILNIAGTPGHLKYDIDSTIVNNIVSSPTIEFCTVAVMYPCLCVFLRRVGSLVFLNMELCPKQYSFKFHWSRCSTKNVKRMIPTWMMLYPNALLL